MKNKPKILVTWWGSLEEGEETAGDLLAVENILKTFLKKSISFDVSSLFPYSLFKNNIVDWKKVNASDYDALVFICGPIIKTNNFTELVNKFQKCKKIAIGVSILPKYSSSYFNPFDIVIPRDGGENKNFFDIALSSSHKLNPLNKKAKKKQIIGLCLRGPQGEYNVKNCLYDRVNEFLKVKIYNKNYEIMNINTILNKYCRDPYMIYHLFSKPDIVITTRLHGALFCIGNKTPFIAIDQIKGGAKLFSVISSLKWPYLYLAEHFSRETLNNAIEELLVMNKRTKEQLKDIRGEAIFKSKNAILSFEDIINKLFFR